MRIALFGTSADPPTAGHQEILKWLSEGYDWVAVWAADNPFKSHQTALLHRAAMLQLLITDIKAPQQNIALEQELSSLRTLETLEKAKVRWGEDAEYTLVIGSDLLNQLPRWYHVEDLLHQVKLLVVPRPGYPINESVLEGVRNLGGKIAIASLTGKDVSSTAFRTQGNIESLTPLVVAYIHQQHLYKCQDASKKRFQLC
ncbi:nicotinate-nucleotide adenylyltransferase [Cylindrospermum sp. FACHB-282]|uniref:nicotinate-nucleotide adenylyltransferase n=1 Tax=Cylindrospermum sp. FACHB-282 TaxID=2692794 RepID=UPI001681ED08|nr:nicotinate-nucleotide adenylyltransferase [Cylindrospermum sp. FACHB-282]MBD2388650.1 nicotinate-nucleotide adenylyltransferase [Cylindrospermum sp. FACHB-282]